MSPLPRRVVRLSLSRLAPVLAVAALLLAGCKDAPPPPEPVRAVKLLTVEVGQYASELEFAAEVRPRIESRLGFRVPGKITRRLVEVGQSIRVGQVLVIP